MNPLGLDDRLVWEILTRQVRRGRLSEVCAPLCGLRLLRAGGDIPPRPAHGVTFPRELRKVLAHVPAFRAQSFQERLAAPPRRFAPALGGSLRTESGLRLGHKCRPRRVIIGPGRDGIAPHAISTLHTSPTPHCTKPALRVRTSTDFGGAGLRRSYLAHLARIRASNSACCRFES